MRVLGMMSGTSFDAIDVAAADLELDGETLLLTPLGDLELPYAPDLRSELAAALPPASTTVERICRLDNELGQAFAASAARGIEELCGGNADLAVSHGQTAFHWVSGGRAHGTLQLGQPAWIAERTGVPVVSDLRSRDVAAGGQGAPLVSVFDRLMIPPDGTPRVALNLGGIANMTVIHPDGAALAYDLGPANALIDASMTALFGAGSDSGGRVAARGIPCPELLDSLLDEPYFALPPPKSTGRELFDWGYVDSRRSAFPHLSADDVVATVTELTAHLVAGECARHGVRDVLASGGGTRNPTLMGRIADLAPGGVTIRSIGELGIPESAKEAYAFALLGYLTVSGLPGSVAACTGARSASLLGSVTPGAGPLRLPAPADTAPRRLRIVPANEAAGTC